VSCRLEAARAALLEQEFPQLKARQTARNRRYYKRQDVIVIRQIRSLLTTRAHHWRGAQQSSPGGARTGRDTEPADREAGAGELEELMRVLRRWMRRARRKTAYHDERTADPQPGARSFPNKNIVSEVRSLVATCMGARGPEFKSRRLRPSFRGPFRLDRGHFIRRHG